MELRSYSRRAQGKEEKIIIKCKYLSIDSKTLRSTLVFSIVIYLFIFKGNTA